MTVPVCYYGSAEPLPARRVLRAGPLTAVYEAGDLRYVRAGGVEVCRRWYAAVRDHNWGTVPGVISDEVIEQTADGFGVRYTSTHSRGDIHFVWRADIEGTADGIRFAFDGEAKSTFRRNRIGFCVLHPPDACAGIHAELLRPDGTTERTQFPNLIAPHNPFRELAGLAHDLHPAGRVRWTFEGDVFETEDQRNWIDASFKTFCTPLRLPFPVEVTAGERVRQVVTLRVEDVAARADARPPPGVLDVGGEWMAERLCVIGLAIPDDADPPAGRERELLRLLNPAHLRAELPLTVADFPGRLRRAAESANALGSKLELAVTVSDRVWEETAALVPVLHAVNPPVARVLAFHDREWVTPERIVTPVVEAFARWDASVPVFVGTTANFTELNRGRPDASAVGGVCYSIQPQEHAFDNASLVECCAAAFDTLASAGRIYPGKPLAVTPVTLRKRVNPYATGPAAPVPPGELPPTVDPRQMSLFGAAWTLGTLKYLASAGRASSAHSVTFYETVGWRGVLEHPSGCPLPDKFPSRPGMVFPLFHVLADAIEFGPAAVLRTETADPLRFDGFAMETADGRVRLLLANMTADEQAVAIPYWRGPARVRVLDETSFDRATADPLGWRAEPGTEHATVDGALLLTLRPYAYACIDCH
ncbi:MAG: hypothetical protein K2X87_13200 [Gemmataceae bacterium]|nr:hypothetical protein [Gemmataceae bacterium]